MHVGSVLVFEGEAPPYEEFVAKIEQRLHLVPRYRQKLAFPPLVQSRPVWIDDPHFNARYHVRHTALPEPAGEEQLRSLAGRIFAQGLDRSKPLWELWLVDRVGEDRFALISKTHHALVDGVSGVDISTVLFDLEPDPPEPEPAPAVVPAPRAERRAVLLGHAVAERASTPLDAARGAFGAARHPERAVAGGGKAVTGARRDGGRRALRGAPQSPLNVRIGSHRRFAWVDADLERFKAIKSALGGTVNDVVLAAVTGALRALRDPPRPRPRGHGAQGDGAGVGARGRGARRARQPRRRDVRAAAALRRGPAASASTIVHEAMGGLKESGQAVGAEVLTRLAGFAAPTVLDQAARLQTRQRFFNLVVTNVPGPAVPALPAGPPAARLLPAGPADAQHRARHRDHVLRRAARLRPARRLRRDAGPRRGRRTTSSARSTSWRAAAGVRRRRRSRSGAAPAPTRSRPPRRSAAALALLLGTVLVAGGVCALLLAFNARDDAGVGGARPRAPASCSPTRAPPPRREPAHPARRGSRTRRPAARTTRGLPTREGRAGPGPDPARARARRRDPLLRRRAPAGGAAGGSSDEVSGPFDAEVAAAGQQVILARRDGAGPSRRPRGGGCCAPTTPPTRAPGLRRGLDRPRGRRMTVALVERLTARKTRARMLRSIIRSAALPSSGSCGATASRHAHLVVAHVGVERRVEDALLGDLAGEHDPLDVMLAEEVVSGVL